MNIEDKSNLPWVEKYRPKQLSDLISQDNNVSILESFISKGEFPNLLFSGPPGTGKTSTIVSLCKMIYKNEYSFKVLELNASDERGINVVRNTIKTFVESISSIFSSNKEANLLKVVILDEADSMTREAQAALRRLIEKNTKRARFCLICNNENKIIPALHSRCIKLKFKQIEKEKGIQRVLDILKNEDMEIDERILNEIFIYADGDMRKILNLLQNIKLNQFNNYGGITRVDYQSFFKITGLPDPALIDNLFGLLMNSTDYKYVDKVISSELKNNGLIFPEFLSRISSKLLELNLSNDIVNNNKLLDLYDELGNLQIYSNKGIKDRYLISKLISIFFIFRNNN